MTTAVSWKKTKAKHGQNCGAAYGLDSKLCKNIALQWFWELKAWFPLPVICFVIPTRKYSHQETWTCCTPTARTPTPHRPHPPAILASVFWEGCRTAGGAQLRLCAGTVNPVAELWGGLWWFYLEATVSIKLVIAPHGLRSRPLLKWLHSLLYLNMYCTHSLSGSGATSKPGRWLIKGSLY